MDKRSKFRAFRGKGANMQYFFKNEARWNRFQASNGILRTIYSVAFFAFVASIVAVAAGLMIWLLSYMLVIGFTIALEDNAGYKMMFYSFKVIPFTLIAFVAAYLARFVFEWLFVGAEMLELRKSRDENRHHIAVGRAVLKTKCVALLSILVTCGALGAISFFVYTGRGENLRFPIWIIPVVLLVFNKIYSTRQFLKVQPDVNAIRGIGGEPVVKTPPTELK